MHTPTDGLGASRFVAFSRDDWARLRDQTPLLLTEADLFALRGSERSGHAPGGRGDLPAALAPAESVRRGDADAAQGHAIRSSATAAKVPYIIGIAGSVAVGKSTTARILQALLSRWPDHPRVDLVTTDGFLLPERACSRRAG